MFEFKILEGNLSVSLSGGTDSSLVLYLLMKNYEGHITVFNTAWDEKPNRFNSANNVYQKCMELTGHTNSELIKTEITVKPNKDNLFSTPLEWLQQGKVDYVYTGLVGNPIGVVLPHDEQRLSNRDDKVSSLIDEDNFYTPFRNTDKKTVAQLYEEHDLLESLFPLTFSCIVSETTEHCDNCWWCEERKWAFSRLI